MIKLFFGAAVAALFATTTMAAPEDDYVIFKTAAAINHACGGLKYLEHVRTLGAAAKAIGLTTEDAHSRDGRMSEEDYETWRAALEARAANEAKVVACTQLSHQYLLWGKGVAAEEIYRGLVLAMHFAGNLSDPMTYAPIEPDRMQAMNRYDGYLQALYGDRFPQFSARQKELAIQQLPVADPYSGFGFGSLLLSPEDASKLASAQFSANAAVDAVFFEVAAESAGFLVRPLLIEDTWTIPDLRPGATPTDPGMPVIHGPHYDLIDLTPDDDDTSLSRLYSVVTLRPDNGLRVQYFGDAAARLVEGTVRLMVRTEPLPEGANVYQFFNTQAFRDGTTSYDGVRVEAGCLSAACFDFPPDATDAFVRDTRNEFAELFASAAPGAQPEPGDVSYRPGRVSNFYAYKLLRQ